MIFAVTPKSSPCGFTVKRIDRSPRIFDKSRHRSSMPALFCPIFLPLRKMPPDTPAAFFLHSHTPARPHIYKIGSLWVGSYSISSPVRRLITPEYSRLGSSRKPFLIRSASEISGTSTMTDISSRPASSTAQVT